MKGEFAAEGERPLEPIRVEPQGRVFDAGPGLEASEHRLRVGPTRHQARVDERARLDVLKTGLGQRFDELDLVGRADGPGLDLEPLAWPFLVDLGVRWEVSHGRSLGYLPLCPGPLSGQVTLSVVAFSEATSPETTSLRPVYSQGQSILRASLFSGPVYGAALGSSKSVPTYMVFAGSGNNHALPARKAHRQ